MQELFGYFVSQSFVKQRKRFSTPNSKRKLYLTNTILWLPKIYYFVPHVSSSLCHWVSLLNCPTNKKNFSNKIFVTTNNWYLFNVCLWTLDKSLPHSNNNSQQLRKRNSISILIECLHFKLFFYSWKHVNTIPRQLFHSIKLTSIDIIFFSSPYLRFGVPIDQISIYWIHMEFILINFHLFKWKGPKKITRYTNNMDM